MSNIKDGLSKWAQPQLVSLIFVTAIIVALAIVVYFKLKKVKPNVAPEGIALLAEQYVSFVSKDFSDITDEKIEPMAPYIFSLLTFLIFGNILGIFGFPAVVTSYSVPLTLGIVTWIGTYAIAIIFQKWRKLRSYLTLTFPVKVIGEIAPLISISFRIFGNVTGGSLLLYLLYYITNYIWRFIPGLGQVNLLGSIIAPAFNLYFDLFNGFIQAYVFTVLTMVYWAEAMEVPDKKPFFVTKVYKKLKSNISSKQQKQTQTQILTINNKEGESI